jgi:hypothetical protein
MSSFLNHTSCHATGGIFIIMQIVKISEFFPGIKSLGGREEGALIRKEIEKVLEKESKVFVDFEGLEVVSHSFADEIFGVLMEEYGWEFVKHNIKPINASSAIKEVLKTVVAFRFYKKENIELAVTT